VRIGFDGNFLTSALPGVLHSSDLRCFCAFICLRPPNIYIYIKSILLLQFASIKMNEWVTMICSLDSSPN
jgi:hypothetical protein